MSSALFSFSGNEQQSVTFSPVLDGRVCRCQIKWNIAAQRWYLNISDNTGSRLLTMPMVASPSGFDIDLTLGVFSYTKMVWRSRTGQIEVITS